MPVKPHIDYRLNKPFLTPIIDIIKENDRIKSFVVDYNPIPESVEIRPGQFVMVWLPGDDEIPMSVSRIGWDSRLTISVAEVGDTTRHLHELQISDKIGIRGPYGNWYEPQPGVAIVIGGGIGMASILPLIYELVEIQKHQAKHNIHIDEFICIEGARTESELLYCEELDKMFYANRKLEYCTDDGTCGFKGFTTERLDLLLKDELQKYLNQPDQPPITVYACGPEIMLKKIFDICEEHNIPIQLSLERMMRCGFGLCGLCALDPTGLLVCKDGPIFSNETLRKTQDFGRSHRDFSGKIKPLGE